MRMGPMWRKIRRVVGWLLLVWLIASFLGSMAYNAVTAPANLGPTEAGVPGEFVLVGNSLTHYEKAGAGDVAVVLLHGFATWSFTWRPTLTALGASGRFTAYAVDMRGFGFTERPGDALYNAEGYARHVEEFIDALGLEDPIIVGHSLGGDVALRVALARPGRVRGLVLVSAAVYLRVPWSASALARMSFPPFHRTALRLTASLFLNRALREAYFDPGSAGLSEVEVNIRKPLQQAGAEDAFLAMARSRSDAVPSAAIRQLRVPTLVVWGEEDGIVPLADGRRLAQEVPGAKLVTYPRTGHIPQEEARERFASDLIDFVAGVLPPA